jgi:flagellar biogenesis protein FliO
MALTLLLIALLGSPLPAARAQASADPAAPTADGAASRAYDPADDPWSSPDVAAPRMDARPLARQENTLWRADTADGGPGGASWFRTSLALAGVVGLIVLLAWGYRAAQGGGGLRGLIRMRSNPLIEVIGRTALAPRHSLCLVRIGPRLVLLGMSPDNVRALDVIDDANLTAQLLGQAARQRPESHTAEFARCLDGEVRTYEPNGHELSEALGPDDAQLRSVHDRLADTLARLRSRTAEA